MNKLLIILMILNLSACSLTKENQEENILPENTSETNEPEFIQDINEGDINELNSSLKSFEAGSTWINETGDYKSNLNTQIFNLETNKTSNLSYKEVFLYPGEITISFEYLSNQENDLTEFEFYDDDNNLVISEKVNQGINEFSFNNSDKLYSSTLNFKFESGNESLNVEIKNFKVKQSEDVYKININQVGYTNDARKIGIFVGHHGDYYEIKSYDTDETIAMFSLSNIIESRQTDEYVARGDFSAFDTSGRYYIESSMGLKSNPFIISKDVYNDISKDALRFFTAQRCGFEVNESISPDMQHGICHMNDAKMVNSAEMRDVTGGWHDAGDYGRYVETAVKAVSDLLIGYMIAPNGFDDNTNHVEEGDGIPDVLDEVRYELEWLLKMQREDGGIYSRAVTQVFPGNILPEDNNEQVYLMLVSTSSAAGFVAVMALASKIYEPFDYKFARRCLDAAIKTNNYLNGAEEYNPVLPKEFSAGDYALADDNYYRFYANVALWFGTDEKAYLDKAFNLIEGDYDLYNTYWEPLLAYPSFLYLLKADKSDSNYEYVYNNFYNYLNGIVDGSSRDAYRNSLNDNYKWGSNQNVADRAMMLLMGYHLSGRRVYKAVAEEHLDYLLGKNCHNMSFVVGYGERYPHHIHHRITVHNGSEFKGALVGGPNSSLEDELVRNMFEGTETGPARIYVDDEDSYSTNEVAIHFNSALVFVLGYLNQGE